MASERLQKTVGDYVAIALSPALIMALVGSLVFYLLELLYRGQYESHLQWVFACFIFAVVLIARISMRPDIESRAGIYGVVLAGAMGLALFRFVDYPEGAPLAKVGWFVNMAIVGLIWWCAHKLTCDCTMVDDDEDATGEGLLDAAGLSERARNVAGPEAPPDEEPLESKPLTAWDRFLAWRERRRKRPHTPGVWVVYFALASLPLFGLGQLTIPPGNEASRRFVFWLLCIYVASGLGLLLTTSFLGLRRYLRQRKVSMPLSVVSTWLLLGTGLVLALVLIGAFIPRPDPEYAVFRLSGLPGSKERSASRYAVNRRDAGRGEGRGSRDRREDPNAKPGSGQQRDSQGGQRAPGKSGSGGRNQGGDQQRRGEQGEQGGRQGQQQGQGRQEGNERNQDESQEQEEQETGASESGERDDSSEVEGSFLDEAGPLGSFLKWIVLIAVALVGGYFLIRFLANFSGWARAFLDWWHALFERDPRNTAAGEEQVEDVVLNPPPPFAEFSDPFADGTAARRAPSELVRYTFAALQSWAWEQSLARQPHETPIEFGDRLAGAVYALATDLPKLADYYSRVTYARLSLGRDCLPVVRNVWRGMTGPVAAPPAATIVAE